jgi:hypothetical protein
MYRGSQSLCCMYLHTRVDVNPVLILLLLSVLLRSKACTGYDRLNIGIAGSNPAWGMDVCPRVSVLCCPVSG